VKSDFSHFSLFSRHFERQYSENNPSTYSKSNVGTKNFALFEISCRFEFCSRPLSARAEHKKPK